MIGVKFADPLTGARTLVSKLPVSERLARDGDSLENCRNTGHQCERNIHCRFRTSPAGRFGREILVRGPGTETPRPDPFWPQPSGRFHPLTFRDLPASQAQGNFGADSRRLR